MLIPANFSYPMFALLLAVNGIGIGPDGRAELGRDHELGAGRPARRRVRRAGHRDERRHGAVDGRLLLADGDRPGQRAAVGHVQRADLARCHVRLPRRPSRRRRRSARCSPRSSAQPDRAADAGRRPDPAAAGRRRRRGHPDRSDVLPDADLRAVQGRPEVAFSVVDRDAADRGGAPRCSAAGSSSIPEKRASEPTSPSARQWPARGPPWSTPQRRAPTCGTRKPSDSRPQQPPFTPPSGQPSQPRRDGSR